nr:hypothetical protein [uncultured Actinoplanes sp.]
MVVGEEFGDGLGDDIVAGGVEVEQGLADGGFEVVGVESVYVAALARAVAVAAPAHVVAVPVVAAVGDGADVLAAALRAGDLPGEGVFGGVRGPLSDLFAALGEDVLGVLELRVADDGRVRVSDDDVPEAFLAQVSPVGDNEVDGALRPGLAAFGAQSPLVEHGGDRAHAEAVPGVEVEDEPDGGRFGLDDQVVVSALVDGVADGCGAAGPETLCGLAFHARDDPVDDHFALELGEDAEHLHEHAADGGGGVEGFGGRAERHSGVGEVVEQ